MRAQANPFAQPPVLWQGVFELPTAAVPLLEEMFAEEIVSSADFELDEAHGIRRVTLLWPQSVTAEVVQAKLAVAQVIGGWGITLLSLEKLAPKDWIAEVKRAFPPLHIGPFYIHGSHVEQSAPPGSTALLVEANAAFGTGEHETTKGCLMALGELCKKRIPEHALDMGCGSAILAMAAAKRWHTPCLGVEIDPVSVAVAKENVRLNRLQAEVTVVVGNGYDAPEVRAGGQFDLIFANILARPLVAMAPKLARHLAPGGTAILSGLLDRQENMVLHAHRAQGLRFIRRIALGPWRVLVLEKPAAA